MSAAENAPRLLGAAFLGVAVTSLVDGVMLTSATGTGTSVPTARRPLVQGYADGSTRVDPQEGEVDPHTRPGRRANPKARPSSGSTSTT
jgi:hypothetical protein